MSRLDVPAIAHGMLAGRAGVDQQGVNRGAPSKRTPEAPMYGSAVATLSLHVVDKQHARLLQHIADAWDLRQTIQIPHVVWPDAIVRDGQGVIDDSETAVHRALDEALWDRLVVRRRITWWQCPERHLSDAEVAEVDWSRMHLLERTTLRSQAEQVVAAGPPRIIRFVVRAEALVLPPFGDEL
jgi:hypothetical protein